MPKRPWGGQFGSLLWVLVWQLGHWYWCSMKSRICRGCRLGSSSIRLCLMRRGWVRGVWHFGQVHLGGCMIWVGVFGFCLVLPLCPLGGPGKRLAGVVFL